MEDGSIKVIQELMCIAARYWRRTETRVTKRRFSPSLLFLMTNVMKFRSIDICNEEVMLGLFKPLKRKYSTNFVVTLLH